MTAEESADLALVERERDEAMMERDRLYDHLTDLRTAMGLEVTGRRGEIDDTVRRLRAIARVRP